MGPETGSEGSQEAEASGHGPCSVADGPRSAVHRRVYTMLESAMEPAYTHGDNTGMTATDTQKK